MHNLHAKLERINLKSLKHIDQKCKRRKKKKEKPVLFLGKESIKHELSKRLSYKPQCSTSPLSLI